MAQVRLTLENGFTAGLKKMLGPINLNFTVPMYCASRLQVSTCPALRCAALTAHWLGISGRWQLAAAGALCCRCGCAGAAV